MAEENLFTTFSNALVETPALALRTLGGMLMTNTDYRFSHDAFPEDVGAEYMNHYMIMKFFTARGQQAAFGGLNPKGFSQNNYNVVMFMPTEAGGGIFPAFEDTHEYAEISMTNVFLNQIGAAKSVIKSGAAATGRAINPGVQVLYKTTQLRTFDFAFLMAPRTEKESETMKNIIKTVRMYAAPLDQGLFYRSPAEVEIEFHNKGKINPHVIKMKRQVITGVTVQYAPQGVYSTFTNGHPVTAMFSIRTREMEIIDRKDVEEGF